MASGGVCKTLEHVLPLTGGGAWFTSANLSRMVNAGFRGRLRQYATGESLIESGNVDAMGLFRVGLKKARSCPRQGVTAPFSGPPART